MRHGALDFHDFENRVIKLAIEKARLIRETDVVEWKDFHDFRRGLASNLFGLGLVPKAVASTLQFYIQTPDSESRKAMEKLEERLKASQLNMNGGQVLDP
jgi:hypothetical protein